MLFTEWNMEDALRVREEETKRNIAFSLLDILDIQTIAEKTGLSIDEIERLRSN